MRLKLPPLQTRTTVLVISASMTAVGAAVSSYGTAIAHDYPERLLTHPLFPIALLMFGLGGVVLYLVKTFSHRIYQKKIVKIIVAIPLIFFALLLSTNGSPMVIAWLFATVLVGAVSLLSEDEEDEVKTISLLGPFAYLILILLGIMTFLPGQVHHLDHIIFGVASIFFGVLGMGVILGRYQWAYVPIRIASGVLLLAISVWGFVLGHPLMHILLIAPLALALIFEEFLKKMRFGQATLTATSQESERIHQFQDLAEFNAWSIFIFILVYVFITPTLSGGVFFSLFVLVYISFIYQYRFKSIKNLTCRIFFLNSLKNLFILALAAHFTGGLHSPLNWFFIVALLSSVIAKKKQYLNIKILFITGYYLFEFALDFFGGRLSLQDAVEVLILEYFIIILTALYIKRIMSLQVKIDESINRANENLSVALEHEREAKNIISSQTVELKQAQEQLEQILGSVADGVVAVDSEGEVVFMNEAALRMVGASQKIAKSMTAVDLLPFKNDDKNLPDIGSIMQSILAEKEEYNIERYASSDKYDSRIFILLPEGTYMESENSKKTYFEGTVVDLGVAAGETRVVITFRNITYRREVDALKTDFMSVAAHQLRTPLSSVRWFLELLNDPTEGKLKKNQKMFAENAYTSLIRMIGLVNGLLAVTRIESSRVPSKPESIIIPVLTQDILDVVEQDIKSKHLSLHVKFDKNIPTINLDPQLSREVFVNLISNAIRYSKDEGEIVISITDDGKEVTWSISDNGIGIPKQQQARIFEKFYRASNAVSAESKGNGLGLYLAKFIITQWNGRIWFESDEGKGTTFYVTIPHEGMKAKEGDVSLHA